MRRERNSTSDLVLAAMMTAVVMVMTLLIRIPVPATQGYIHPGDGAIFLAVFLLGWKKGAVAGGLGAAMADVLGGFAIYAPVTFFAKFAMAAIAGLVVRKYFTGQPGRQNLRVAEALGGVVGGLVMVAIYYLAESAMYGSFVTPLVEVPMNILQFAVGMAVAMALEAGLSRQVKSNP